MRPKKNGKIRRWWRRGQSLVEFAILLPLVLIMLSGLIEFGFLLNEYLDLIDAAREVARFAADEDPIRDDAGNFDASPGYDPCAGDPPPAANPGAFYGRVWTNTDRALDMGGQISLDPFEDDVVVSLFSVNFGTVSQRYPLNIGSTGGEAGWQRWCNDSSKFTTAEVQTVVTDTIAKNGTITPNTGVVLVEIFYDYHMIMGLPWISAFVPDPVPLHVYAVMPNAAMEPTPTP
jgi:hypothetical protein